MREIKFRAKRLLNGEYVEGHYTKAGENHYILPGRYDLSTYSHPSFECYEIDHKTLCECAGTTDKNGKMIFEGDIIKEDDCVGVVKFGKYVNPCDPDLLGGHIGFYVNFKNDLLRKELAYWSGISEIIGNIFDNPELIKG